MLSGELSVKQAPMFDGLSFDADSDDAAHPFRSDRAHHSDLMPPG